ncbi:MAG: hypothetical protein OFPII_30190 [Osedax symbiont Rs1]|nr:MAG: hypothetical protein OFPII_30190 [Osedax symbiont Rs1]
MIYSAFVKKNILTACYRQQGDVLFLVSDGNLTPISAVSALT